MLTVGGTFADFSVHGLVCTDSAKAFRDFDAA